LIAVYLYKRDDADSRADVRNRQSENNIIIKGKSGRSDATMSGGGRYGTGPPNARKRRDGY